MKSDTQLQKDVTEELSWEPSIKATEIGVEVKDGVVTLSGHVESYAEKWGAEHAAQRVAGVKALTVEIEVKLLGSSKRTDADIARSAQNMLEWTTFLPKEGVKVMVENGWVTLSGEVNWGFQSHSSASTVRNLIGVVGVTNNITIKKRATSSTVKSQIEASLKRRAIDDARKITVAVDGTGVTLGGMVSSWSERTLAKNSAWGTPGVSTVVDNMTMTY